MKQEMRNLRKDKIRKTTLALAINGLYLYILNTQIQFYEKK